MRGLGSLASSTQDPLPDFYLLLHVVVDEANGELSVCQLCHRLPEWSFVVLLRAFDFPASSDDGSSNSRGISTRFRRRG